MKTPFQFPNYEEWVNTHENTVGHLIHRKIWNGPTTYYAPQTYALFYLLALRDWVNEGFITDKDHGSATISYFMCMGWLIDRTQVGVMPLLFFRDTSKASEFLSHKSDHTDTITQLNVLYSINQ